MTMITAVMKAAEPHLNVCRTALLRRSMIFSRSSLEQVSSSLRSWFRSRDVTRPISSISRTMLSALMPRWKQTGGMMNPNALTAESTNQSDQNLPDVPKSDFLVKVATHDTLLRAHDVITAGAGEDRLHACTR